MKSIAILLTAALALGAPDAASAGTTPDALYFEITDGVTPVVSTRFREELSYNSLDVDWSVYDDNAWAYISGWIDPGTTLQFELHWSDTTETLPMTSQISIATCESCYHITPAFKLPGQDWYLGWQQTDLTESVMFGQHFPAADELSFRFDIGDDGAGAWNLEILMHWGPEVATGTDSWGAVKSLYR